MSAIADYFAYDVQYSFGILHSAYLPVVFRLNHLSSFAMYRAFPGSDYYEDSVTIGVSPVGHPAFP